MSSSVYYLPWVPEFFFFSCAAMLRGRLQVNMSEAMRIKPLVPRVDNRPYWRFLLQVTFYRSQLQIAVSLIVK